MAVPEAVRAQTVEADIITTQEALHILVETTIMELATIGSQIRGRSAVITDSQILNIISKVEVVVGLATKTKECLTIQSMLF